MDEWIKKTQYICIRDDIHWVSQKISFGFFYNILWKGQMKIFGKETQCFQTNTWLEYFSAVICQWILRHLRSLCLVRSVRQRKHHHTVWYSCLGNPKDRGAWQATVHGVAKSWTWLSNQVHTHTRWDIYTYRLKYRIESIQICRNRG